MGPVPSHLSRPRPHLAVVGKESRAEPDDVALASALGRGDRQAQREAWDRFSPLVRGLLRRTFGPDHMVEDLVQDVFVGLFRNVSRLQKLESLRSFLIGITVRIARKELRRRRTRRLLGLSHSATTPEPVAPEALDSETVQALYRLFERVGDETRLLFVLRYVNQLSMLEMEAALNMSRSTLKRRLKRASDRVFELARRDPLLAEYVGHGHQTGRDEDDL